MLFLAVLLIVEYR